MDKGGYNFLKCVVYVVYMFSWAVLMQILLFTNYVLVLINMFLHFAQDTGKWWTTTVSIFVDLIFGIV